MRWAALPRRESPKKSGTLIASRGIIRVTREERRFQGVGFVANDRNGSVLRQIRAVFEGGNGANLTDGQLLERFATRDGEVAELAFAALVERHGAMVLNVCR